ncbi:MspA family porin [Nocardia sp. NPDC057227]|uniref:MspA family porin n=1 Tax=Nocardia sp. NPDC057227 TaxID=3346056 RepID=UPI003645B89A
MTRVPSHSTRGHRAGLLTAGLAAAMALTFGAGTAFAGVDSTDRVIDGKQRTISAIQADTTIRAVPPLDRNPLTRQWFHDVTAQFTVEGDKADEFAGTIKIGYLVGFPATVDGRIKFGYTSPRVGIETDNGIPGPKLDVDLIPTVTGEIETGFGPGVRQIEAVSGRITGSEGSVRLTNSIGTVTGVIGTATVQPYVTVVSDTGDSVTTLGKPYEVN